jgi:hypothetical protein
MLFIESPAFTRAVTKLPDDDYAIFQLELAADPEQSGGARVIYLYLAEQQLIVLVTLYAKARKADLSKTEENELRKISAEIRRSLGTGKS